MSAGNESSNVSWHAGLVSRDDRQRLLGQKGVIVWLTGLSAAGKSTIACLLEQRLVQMGKHAYRLDGDNLRRGLNAGLGFSAADRAENIRRAGELAKLFADAGLIVICSLISPYRRDRDLVRGGIAAADFIEVHVDVSLQTAERRDPKGLYKEARAGRIAGFTGIDDPYEAPLKPEIRLDSERLSPAAAAQVIFDYLQQRGYLA